MKSAVALDLALQAIKEIALEFHDLAAALAGHVDVIALRTALVEMLLALHVHQIQLIDQPVALQQTQRAINSDPVDLRVDPAGAAENLAGIEMLLGGFDNAKNRATLARHAQATRHQLSLQPSRSFCLGKGHGDALRIQNQ